jgi:hypothetical protein
VLISEDETATIIDTEENFVICPLQSPEIADHHRSLGGSRCVERLRYASDTNTEWLDARALREMLAQLDA